MPLGGLAVPIGAASASMACATGVSFIVACGMAAFALLFDQSPLLLGPIAGIATFFDHPALRISNPQSTASLCRYPKS
jgi:hypothetical protein